MNLFTAGYTPEEVRELPEYQHTVGIQTLTSWYEIFHMCGGVIPSVDIKRRDKFCPEAGAFILALLDEDPSLYLRELRHKVKAEGLGEPSLSSMHRHLRRNKLCLRKLAHRAIQASEREAEECWQWMRDIGVKASQMVFIDETQRSRTLRVADVVGGFEGGLNVPWQIETRDLTTLTLTR